MLLGASGAQTPKVPPHDPAVYGRRLECQKVEGVKECMAVEVVERSALCRRRWNAVRIRYRRTGSRPVLLGKLAGLGTTRQLFVKGHIAYVTARQDGLWMVDVSQPETPKLISHYDSVEMATGIWVSGNLGFIATRCYGVEIIDVSDPAHVRHVSTLKTGEAQSCWARDGLLYIGDWHPKKLLVADVRNPREPVIVGEGLLDGYGDGGCLRGKYCYAASGHHSRNPDREEAEARGHGLDIFDVSEPAQPALVGRVKFPRLYSIFNDMWSARVAGDYCVVADTWNGVFVVDVRDPAQPAIVAHAQLPEYARYGTPDPVGGIALGKDVIYAAGIYTGLYVVSAPGLAQPVVPEPDNAPQLAPVATSTDADPDFLTYRPEGQVHSVAVQGDLAWTACGAAGIHAVRLGEKPKPVGTWPGKGEVYYLHLSGNRIVTAEGSAGVGIYEIGPGPSLTEIGRLDLNGRGVKQVVAPAPGHFALIHCGGATIFIADVRDPAHAKVIFTDSQVGLFYGDQLVDQIVGGRYLVAYWQRSGPAWYDISGPAPRLTGNTPDTGRYGWSDGVCPFGDKLLLVKRGAYRLLEPNETRTASDLPAYTAPGVRITGWPRVDDTTLALSRRYDRIVRVVDISEFAHPKLLREYSLFGHPGACAFWHGKLVIPAGYQGLLVERTAAK